MARTSDPHAATIKAWQTRARNAGGGGVVQSGSDWGSDHPYPEKYKSGDVKSPEQFIDIWTGDPRSTTATVAQYAAEELGWGRAYDTNREAGGPPRNGTTGQRDRAKEVLAALYRDTQASFATNPPPNTFERNGIRFVRLHRGTGRSRGRGNIESWTSDRKLAREIAEDDGDEDRSGVVRSVDVPLTSILAWHRGPHWERDLGESEYILAFGAS